MDMFKILAHLVSTTGFPIVCFGACAWYVKYREDKNDTKTEKLTDAINNNTLALQKLTDKLEE